MLAPCIECALCQQINVISQFLLNQTNKMVCEDVTHTSGTMLGSTTSGLAANGFSTGTRLCDANNEGVNGEISKQKYVYED